MHRFWINLCLAHCRDDASRDVQDKIVFLDFCHFDSAAITHRFLTELTGLDDLINAILRQQILALAFHTVLRRIDDQSVEGFLHFLGAKMQAGIPVEQNRFDGWSIAV